MERTTRLEDRERNLELIHDEVKQRLQAQMKAIERIETKAVVLAGFAATAVQLMLSRQAHTRLWLLAVSLLALSFLASLGVITLTRYQDPPSPQALVEKYEEVRKVDTLARVVGMKVEAYALNALPARRKVVLSWCSVVLLIAGLAFATANG